MVKKTIISDSKVENKNGGTVGNDIVLRTVNKISNKKITRRSFLKGVLAFFAMVGIGNWLGLGKKLQTKDNVKTKTKKVDIPNNNGYGGKTSYGI